MDDNHAKTVELLTGISSQYRRRVLEVCTSHIPEHTAKGLGSGTADEDVLELYREAPLFHALSYVPWHEFGWIFYVTKDSAAYAIANGHPELAALIELAVNLDFNYLSFDRDANELPESLGYPTFNW